MKRCPTCNRTYADLSLNFCLDDGTPLTTDAAAPPDLNATIRYPSPRDTSEPPPTEIYRPATPPPPPPRPTQPPPQQAQPQWTPTPAVPQKKSNAVWWILGGFAAVLVIGVGLVVMIIALASLGSNTNSNAANVNANANSNRNANVNANANANLANTNANANVSRVGPLIDDFSQQKWGTGTSQFGRIWYTDGEYHMVSKAGTFVVMYAPSNDYSTENATIKVTARSVDGSVPSSGFGLTVHGVQTRGQLEDYALLIFPSAEPEYSIIMHKQGSESIVVERTKSDAIKPGSAPNELEVRTKGAELSFYVNGQFLKTITDRENFRRGRVGFYTSDVFEVAFDDLQIERAQLAN